MRRALIIIGAILLALAVAATIYWLVKDRRQGDLPADIEEEDVSAYFTPSMLPRAPAAEPTGDRIGIQSPQGITYVNNFYAAAFEKNAEFLVLSDDERFTILYFREGSSFLISIDAPPVQQNRLAGEDALLRVLGISKADACRLSVSSGVPEYVDPELAGTNYGLSFCP